MAINRRVVNVSVDITTSGADYAANLKDAWETACSGGNFYIAHVEKREAGSKREGYTLWLEEEV